MKNPQIQTALNIVNQLIPLVKEAESQFKSARTWSFFDILGGGTITDLIKHYKLNKASNTMNEVNNLLQQLNMQLSVMPIPAEYKMQVGGFLTFADFLFDGVLVDVYVASKIWNSIDQVKKLKEKLKTLKTQLESMY